ncbi:MAG: hypothetical protein QOF48_3862 [Verrucomicrobiota bacterium]|jgi:uncharacterized protein (TIGR03790 family)
MIFPMMKRFLPLVFVTLALSSAAMAQSPEVVVVYNSGMPESKEVAEYYAKRRSVPPNQVVGLDLPRGEAMTRQEFIDKLQKPLRQHLERHKLFIYGLATNLFPNASPDDKPFRVITEARIRYAALCYGVPVKILRDTHFVEARTDKLPAELRRNEAAVDTQLACLLDWEGVFPWTGPMENPFYGATNFVLHPTNGLLLVTRLDGPSASIARGLVDKAMEAETNGLLGRVYVDSRGLTNGNYKAGDDWMRQAAAALRQAGYETVLDEKPETFSPGYPMSQIAFYLGWYDQQVSGPFTRPTVEFMPGAFAYHLYSFSAQSIRAPNSGWVAALLQKGATCTMGMVDEPYLQYTPDIYFCCAALGVFGYSFGEAAYASQTALSWQTTIIGDPLYRPRVRSEAELRADLQQRGSPRMEWIQLMAANRKLAAGAGIPVALDSLETDPLTRRSAVLTEKVGDLYWGQTRVPDAIDAYEAALKRGPSPMQRLRLLLSIAEKRAVYGPDEKALGWYETVLKEYPDYPEPLWLHQQILPLAKRLGRTNVVDRCEKEIRRLAAATNGTRKP